MNLKNDVSRMTIDIPKKSHKQLKALSAILGKSMRHLVLESIDEYIDNIKVPNKETRKVMEEVEKGIGLSEIKNIDELVKKLGI